MHVDSQTVKKIATIDPLILRLIASAAPDENGQVCVSDVEQVLYDNNAQIAKRIFDTIPDPKPTKTVVSFASCLTDGIIDDMLDAIHQWACDVGGVTDYGLPGGGRVEIKEVIRDIVSQRIDKPNGVNIDALNAAIEEGK